MIDSTESHDNPFVLDGELQRKADFILQHSTISRRTLTIADPDQLRTATETADYVRTITETADPGRAQLIHASLNHDQSAVNGFNYKADIRDVSGKEREQEAEVLYVGGLASPGGGGSVSQRGGRERGFTVENRLGAETEAECTVEHRSGEREENGYTVADRLGARKDSAFTVKNRLGRRKDSDFTVENRLGEVDKNGSTVENRLKGGKESEFTVDNRFTVDGHTLTQESHVGNTIEMDGVITEAERSRQCCLIQ